MNLEEKLKKLLENFSYKDFIKLLDEIDFNPNISVKAQMLLYKIMSLVNPNYIVNDVPITLGHKLLKTKLINKKKITPSLIFFFYEEQLERLGLYKIPVFFSNGNYDMCHISSSFDNFEQIVVNLNKFDKYNNIDLYNYNIMRSCLHEIVHSYQRNCKINSTNPMENLVARNYANAEKFMINFNHGSTENNILVHDSYLTEIEADNNSILYMLYLVQNNPECFNLELSSNELIKYKKRIDYLYNCQNGYSLFSDLISCVSSLLRNKHLLSDNANNLLKIIAMENEECRKLDLDNGINSIDYNIFLNKYCTFSDEKIIVSDEYISKKSK